MNVQNEAVQNEATGLLPEEALRVIPGNWTKPLRAASVLPHPVDASAKRDPCPCRFSSALPLF
jgi:hypothetical protein